MPGLVRKLLIFASVNGLVIQAQGPVEHGRALQISYGSHKLDAHSVVAEQQQQQQHKDATRSAVALEAHGLIGLLSIASASFLVAITRREQVAQIFGRPVYVVTDVALLPLSSEQEAARAIASAIEARKPSDGDSDSESIITDSEPVDGGRDDYTNNTSGISSSPADDDAGDVNTKSEEPSPSIAQDVFNKRAQFGPFASEWFSRRNWPVAPTTTTATATATATESTGATEVLSSIAAADTAHSNRRLPDDSSSISAMVPKILRSTRMILSSRSFFFSYEFDLTRRMSLLHGVAEPPTRSKLDPLAFWNRQLARPFFDAGQDSFLMPIIQGFVGQRTFNVKKRATAAVAGEDEAAVEQPFLLTMISRRSTKRSGLRYLRRGIDDEGNCANSVETEQILSAPDWDRSKPIHSFVQLRASIPLFFSQSPYSFKPLPQFHRSRADNDAAFRRHFNDLKVKYGGVQIGLLVDKHATEVAIGEAYEATFRRLREDGDSSVSDGVDFEWFDFHAECRGMKFENVSRLVDKLKAKIDAFGETVVRDGVVQKTQTGIVRTNCMDCLDRTNVVESALGQYMLQTALASQGFDIDLVGDESTTWFNTLWADNGDAISRQYAGTAALKGDFTRTRRRNVQGAVFDFSLTLTRYYKNMFNDYFSQAVVDLLLGRVSWRAFEDFEATMKSSDPGISIAKVRDGAIETCRKVVVGDEQEEMLQGWTVLAPAYENTLRTLPFQEAVLLLTDAALYCCRFDWDTEKVASYERVDLRSISHIRYGTYIVSTVTEGQTNERTNVGLAVAYKPGKESIQRTNTRSLQTQTPTPAPEERQIDGGTGIPSSWSGAARPPAPAHLLAVKVIPPPPPPASDESAGDPGRTTTPTTPTPAAATSTTPLSMAREYCREIERAIASLQEGSPGTKVPIEQGDIISLAEAKRRTGYLEQIGHSIKLFVWT